MASYHLGIDNGCTVSKAGLFTLVGQEVAVASAKNALLCPEPGWQERDMEQMWQATAGAIKEVLTAAQIDPRDIACVTCTGHGNGLYAIDKQGRPAGNAILSTDARARDIVSDWMARGIDKAVRPKTMQSVWPAQPNALLAWLRDHDPSRFQRIDKILMAKDFIRYQLTGRVAAELTDFSGTSLLNLEARQYDQALLETFGIGEMMELLPPLVRSDEICGQVTEEAAAQTGLAPGTPVAGGMFDIDACGLASGVIYETQLCMVIGTWGNNQYIAKTPVVSEDVFMTSCYALPEYYLMLEGSATSGSNLEWFVSEFFAAEKEQAEQQGGSVYELCNDLVAATTPQESDIVFLPFLYGSNANPDARATLLGMTAWHQRGHVLRAIYEGVVFGHKHHVERLLKFRSMPEVLRITGGATRSDVWLQIFADCFQIPVQVPDGSELGALGAAIAGGVAVNCFKDYEEAVQKMVHFSRRIEPNPEMAAVYQQKYTRYQTVIETLDAIWTR